MSDDNIIKFGTVQGGKLEEETVPEHDYAIVDINGDVFTATGFLIFTPQHVAIMRNLDEGALPVVVVPLASVKVARLQDPVQADLFD